MMADRFPKVAAVIVTYFPDTAILSSLIEKLQRQVQSVILVDNGGGSKHRISGVDYIELEGNYGLGYALNRGFRRAIESGFEYVASFDQDSLPPDNYASILLDQHIRLKQRGVDCIAIGPLCFDYRDEKKAVYPAYRENTKGKKQTIDVISQFEPTCQIQPVDMLITSGMLINADLWSKSMFFDEGWFVDYTDMEWCFRARDAGYELYCSPLVPMGHALSDAKAFRFFGFNLLTYSPLRNYYFFRNSIVFCRKPYVSFAWRKRVIRSLLGRVLHVFLRRQQLGKHISMISKAVLDALHNRLGPYPVK